MIDEALLRDRLAAVRILILDVDGVLTDGRIFFGGEEDGRFFDVRDGAGIKYLLRSGVEVAFVTGRESRAVERRASDLGVAEVCQKALRKWPVVAAMLERRGLKTDQAAYVGDDLMDLPVIVRVGLGIAVADAAEEVRRHAHAVTERPGGGGAVREVAEAILRAQGKWQAIVDSYLKRETDERDLSS